MIDQNQTVVPKGRYLVTLIGSEQRPHWRTRTRSCLQVRLLVAEGLYRGVVLYDWLHLHHRATKRERDETERKLDAMARATNSPYRNPQCGRHLVAVVKQVPKRGAPGVRLNQIIDYEPAAI